MRNDIEILFETALQPEQNETCESDDGQEKLYRRIAQLAAENAKMRNALEVLICSQRAVTRCAVLIMENSALRETLEQLRAENIEKEAHTILRRHYSKVGR